MKVLATTTIVGDVVRQVAGETVQLDVLLPAGVDEHSYQYTPADVAMAARADLIFINGAGLEPFVTSLLESAGGDARLVSLSEGIPLQDAAPQYPEHEGMQGGDPHVWTDPNNVSIWVERIAATLSEIDPQSAHVYQQNAETYRKELRALDDWIIQQVEFVPAENRKLVSDHQFFTYFAQRYGFEQPGAVISSYSSLAEPSAQELANLEDMIRQFGIKAIFVGNNINPALSKQVAEDTGAKVVPLYSGSLSEPDEPASNYLDYMRYNVDAIVNALREN